MRFLRYILPLISLPLILACGMAAPIPSSDGQKGSATVNMATHVNTPITSNLESVSIVTADVLTVRVCPAQECQVAYRDGAEFYFHKGDPVMGACYRFVDEIWLGFDFVNGEPTKFAAVLFDGEWLMEGNCQ